MGAHETGTPPERRGEDGTGRGRAFVALGLAGALVLAGAIAGLALPSFGAGPPPAAEGAAQPVLLSAPADAPLGQVPGSDTVPPVPEEAPECPAATLMDPATPSVHAFYFARAQYSTGMGGGRGWGWGRSWSTDFPKSDRQFLYVVQHLLDIDAYACESPVRLDDPALRNFPFLYMVEPGRGMQLTPEEAEGLRNYLLAGGFLLVDDFWGSAEWANFSYEMREVFPDREIVEVPMDHPIFDVGFEVDELLTVPSINNARRGGRYYERDGDVPHMRGIFDADGRLMVAIAWNTDLGDAWEWAEQPDYPRDRSDYAFKLGVNFILYAMTH